MSTLMFGVIAPERLPIWKYPSISQGKQGKDAMGVAYTSTVHIVVDSAKFFKSSLHHVLHTFFIGDVNFHCYRLERGVLGEFLALFGSSQGALFVDVCKRHTFGASFGKCKGCFFANAAGGLKQPSQQGFVMGQMKRACPSNECNAA